MYSAVVDFVSGNPTELGRILPIAAARQFADWVPQYQFALRIPTNGHLLPAELAGLREIAASLWGKFNLRVANPLN